MGLDETGRLTNLGSIAIGILVRRWDTTAFLRPEGRWSLEYLSSSKTVRTGSFRRAVGGRSSIQGGEFVKRGNPLGPSGVLFFVVGMKPVLLTQMLSPFRRVRTARVTCARVGTVPILLIRQLAGPAELINTSHTSWTFIRENFSSRLVTLFVTPFNG